MATNVKATKKYKALIAVGLSPEQAMKALSPEPVKDDPRAQLIAAGFTPEQADGILGTSGGTADADEVSEADALVEASPYKFAKGRVYVNSSIVEGVVRVIKTGKPEIVTTSGTGRTKAVLLVRQDSGDVSIQNLA
jgi:hypothetical protein